MKGYSVGKVLSPAKKKVLILDIQQDYKISERRACHLVSQHRSTQRRIETMTENEMIIREMIIDLAKRFGRYGYRRVWAIMVNEGIKINHKKVYRIWREEGLKVPSKQPKRERLWFNEGSCIRLRPEYKNHVWSYDFVQDMTHDGRKIRMLTIMDEYTRESLAIVVKRKLNSKDVVEALCDLFIKHGIPENIRSDNGPEFIAKYLRKWLKEFNVNTLYIEPGSPWENGYIESFNGKLRDELLAREIFYTLTEAQVLIEQWRLYYNHKRPHSSLNYKPPVPETRKLDYYENVS